MEIHTVCLEINTHCDLRCPDCCAGVGMHRFLTHHPCGYFETAAVHLKGIDRVHLSGGEPTLHPKFAEFLPQFRELFGCRLLTMVSNGFAIERYADLIVQHLDWLNFSDFHIRAHIPEMLRARGLLVNIEDEGAGASNFVPRIKRANGIACTRACWRSGGFGYADGKMWGCSVAPGIEGTQGMEPCAEWRERLPQEKLPCAECWFAE